MCIQISLQAIHAQYVAQDRLSQNRGYGDVYIPGGDRGAEGDFVVHAASSGGGVSASVGVATVACSSVDWPFICELILFWKARRMRYNQSDSDGVVRSPT